MNSGYFGSGPFSHDSWESIIVLFEGFVIVALCVREVDRCAETDTQANHGSSPQEQPAFC